MEQTKKDRMKEDKRPNQHHHHCHHHHQEQEQTIRDKMKED